MRVKRPVQTALTWLVTNVLLQLLESHTYYRRIKYEDFMRDPQSVLLQVAADCGKAKMDLPFLKHGAVWFEEAHTVSGNPIRFQRGWTRLATDVEWERKLSKSHRRVVSALTAPLLAKYGYL